MVNGQQMVNVDKLKPHPMNAEIYGNEDVTDLIAQIVASGKIFNPIKINEDYTIISGHRRWQAAKALDMQEIPCEYVNFESEEEELAALVMFNYQRQKTNEQKTREGMLLEETLRDESALRRISTLKQNQSHPEVDTGAMSEDTEPSSNSDTKSEKGTTRDKVAEAIKIGSGRSYDRMKAVIIEVDKLKKDGKTDNADLLIYVLDKAPTTAYKLLQVDLDSLTDEEKKDICSGKASQVIQSHSTGEKPIKAKSFNRVMKELDAITHNLKDIFNTLDEFNGNEIIKLDEAIEPVKKAILRLEGKITNLRPGSSVRVNPDSNYL